MMTRIFAGIAGALLAVSALHGQEVRETALTPLAFLTGQWLSTDASEVQEEIWSRARGDSMIGSFRVLEHGKPVFYEFWAVEIDDNHPVLKMKHFNADLVGWEEKSTSTRLPMVSSGPNDVVFAEQDGNTSLHYHRTGEKLTCVVHHMRDGKASDETFELHRVSAATQH